MERRAINFVSLQSMSIREKNLSVGPPKQNQLSLLLDELGTMSPRPNAWTLNQNQMYVDFLKEYKDEFEDEQRRRESKIFLQMSMNIPNKTPQQCRTHHQKSLRKYEKVQNIIAKLLPDLKKRLMKMLEAQQNRPEVLKTENYYQISSWANCLILTLEAEQIEQW